MSQNVNSVALVTGATRGIGRAIAIELAKEGYEIAFCYRSNDQMAIELSAEIENLGRRSFCQKVDVANFEAVTQFVAQVEEDLGAISVLVNNAGITSDASIVSMEFDAWKRVTETNLDGTFNFCRASIFEMLKRKNGAVINISSAAGVYGNAGQVNYSSSKAGMIGFTKSMSKEVGRRGIRVNAVAPGFIETDMTGELSEKLVDNIKKQTSLKRIGQAQEVADLVSFLVSDKSSYITGQVFCIDGGLAI